MAQLIETTGGVGDGPRQRIVEGLLTCGFAAEPGYVSPALVRALRREVRQRDARGQFSEAAVGRHNLQQQNEFIRRDRTFWLDGSTLAQLRLLDELEQLRIEINRSLFLGLFDLEAHFALYPPGGFYRRHLDAFRGDNPRVVSVVVYLNPRWQQSHGGCLRVWPDVDAVTPLLDVAPRAGTLVCFLSERIPHEVLAAHADRISIAGWFRRNEGPGPWSAPSL
ncbi:2OG-Fe(II) oxygenase [Alcanivorax sp. 1008]|uniref:2OG-Fe(II) oxygenase n=1 Tax=Alcanivorax sp. 1008 TaxID=2816853 RepID=UPI001D860F11|nr:2OG-Fe(II) oxygenase [Alcanivorax sp. 1008]MCC1497611.1 2OG-Fe(II) oxygenase [Alcanivorax sp. 1008]